MLSGRVVLILLLALASVTAGTTALPAVTDPLLGPGSCAPSSPAQARPGTGATFRTTTFEAFQAGNVYGVALHAPDANTVYVAYKKFRTNDDYASADLVLAKSINGGWTWSRRVLDADAMDSRDPTGNAVAIDGSGRTVAVAWQEHRGPSRDDVRLKVAVSTDEGNTFRTSLVVPSRGGESPAIVVSDPLNIVVAYRDLSGVYGGLAMARSRDGGATWETKILHDRITTPRSIDVSSPTATHTFIASGAQSTNPTLRLDTTGDAGLTWRERLATPGSKGPSVAAPTPLDVYVADGSSEQGGMMKVKVGHSRDGGTAWCLRVFDEAYVVHGTAVEAISPSEAWVGYWKLDDAADLVLARTMDRGASWQLWSVPHTFDIWIDFDIASPANDIAYAAFVDGYDMRVVRLDA